MVEELLLCDGEVDFVVFEYFFYMLMVINLCIELYVFDLLGWIFVYEVFKGWVDFEMVDFVLVWCFFVGECELLYGDDLWDFLILKIFLVVLMMSGEGEL